MDCFLLSPTVGATVGGSPFLRVCLSSSAQRRHDVDRRPDARYCQVQAEEGRDSLDDLASQVAGEEDT